MSIPTTSNGRGIENSEPVVITRGLVKRAWSDFEPKLLTAMISGQAAIILFNILGAYHINLDENTRNELTWAIALLAGYFMPSAGTTITKVRKDNGETVSESHTGTALTTITAGIPTQAPAPRQAPAGMSVKDLVTKSTGEVAAMPVPPSEPTTVIPPTNGGNW